MGVVTDRKAGFAARTKELRIAASLGNEGQGVGIVAVAGAEGTMPAALSVCATGREAGAGRQGAVIVHARDHIRAHIRARARALGRGLDPGRVLAPLVGPESALDPQWRGPALARARALIPGLSRALHAEPGECRALRAGPSECRALDRAHALVLDRLTMEGGMGRATECQGNHGVLVPLDGIGAEAAVAAREESAVVAIVVIAVASVGRSLQTTLNSTAMTFARDSSGIFAVYLVVGQCLLWHVSSTKE